MVPAALPAAVQMDLPTKDDVVRLLVCPLQRDFVPDACLSLAPRPAHAKVLNRVLC